MKRLLAPLLVLIVASAGFFWWWMQPDKVVARRVKSFFETAEIGPDTGKLVRASVASSLEKYLANRVVLKGSVDEAEGEFTRDNLTQMYGALASYSKSITIGDPQIESIAIAGDRATVHAQIDATVEVPGRQILDGTQDVTMVWIKGDDGWRLSEASWKELPH